MWSIYCTSSTQNGAVQLLQETRSALPNSNCSFSDRVPSEAISSVNCEMSGLVPQDTQQNSKNINATLDRYASFSAMKPLFLHRESILYIKVLRSIRNYGGMVLHYMFPPYLFKQFSRKSFSRNQILPLIRKIYSMRNISALRNSIAKSTV